MIIIISTSMQKSGPAEATKHWGRGLNCKYLLMILLRNIILVKILGGLGGLQPPCSAGPENIREKQISLSRCIIITFSLTFKCTTIYHTLLHDGFCFGCTHFCLTSDVMSGRYQLVSVVQMACYSAATLAKHASGLRHATTLSRGTDTGPTFLPGHNNVSDTI